MGQMSPANRAGLGAGALKYRQRLPNRDDLGSTSLEMPMRFDVESWSTVRWRER